MVEIKDKKTSNHELIRKLIVPNSDKEKPPLYFELDKLASYHRPELGTICSIRKVEMYLRLHGMLVHEIFIERSTEDGREQRLWKRIWPNAIEEFNID